MSVFLENLKKALGADYVNHAHIIIKKILDHYPHLQTPARLIVSECINEIVKEYLTLTGREKIVLNERNAGLSRLSNELESNLFIKTKSNEPDTIGFDYNNIIMRIQKLMEITATKNYGRSLRNEYAANINKFLTLNPNELAKAINESNISDGSIQGINMFICFEVIPFTMEAYQLSDIIRLNMGMGTVVYPCIVEFDLLKKFMDKYRKDNSPLSQKQLSQAYCMICDLFRLYGLDILTRSNIYSATIVTATEGKFCVDDIPEENLKLTDESIKSIITASLVKQTKPLSTDMDVIREDGIGTSDVHGIITDYSEERVNGVINHTAFMGDLLIDDERKFRDLILLVSDLDKDKVRTYLNAKESLPINFDISDNQLSSLYVSYPDIKKIQTTHPVNGPMTIVKYKDIIGVLFTSTNPDECIYMVEIDKCGPLSTPSKSVRRVAAFSINATTNLEFQITSEFTLPSEDGGEL